VAGGFLYRRSIFSLNLFTLALQAQFDEALPNSRSFHDSILQLEELHSCMLAPDTDSFIGPRKTPKNIYSLARTIFITGD